MQILRGVAFLFLVLAGLALIAAFFVPVPWYGPVGAAISLCVPGAVLLALDRIIELLTDIRDAMRGTGLDAQRAKEDGFLRGEDKNHHLGGAAARYLSKGRVAPDDIPA